MARSHPCSFASGARCTRCCCLDLLRNGEDATLDPGGSPVEQFGSAAGLRIRLDLMPRRLLERCQPDSIREFRAAGRQRFDDALALAAAGHRTGAIYLWGYTAEMI